MALIFGFWFGLSNLGSASQLSWRIGAVYYSLRWTSLETDGTFLETPGTPLEIPGNPWDTMGHPGKPWKALETFGNPWTPRETPLMSLETFGDRKVSAARRPLVILAWFHFSSL